MTVPKEKTEGIGTSGRYQEGNLFSLGLSKTSFKLKVSFQCAEAATDDSDKMNGPIFDSQCLLSNKSALVNSVLANYHVF